MPLSFTQCFAKYGATLANPMWAVSAKANDGSIVVSCWEIFCARLDKETLRYSDKLSRWEGNTSGNNLLREHLNEALRDDLFIRLVIARAEDVKCIKDGKDASASSNTFHVRPDLVGKLTSFDGDAFIIDFKRE